MACQYMSQPLHSHWQAVNRIFRYLKGTATLGLYFSPIPNQHRAMYTFCDADWAQTLMIGVPPLALVFLDSNLVPWWTKKQLVISRSSTNRKTKTQDFGIGNH